MTTLASNIPPRRVAASATTLNVSVNVPKKRAVIVEPCAVTDAMRFGIVRLNADVHTGRVCTKVLASRFGHDPRPFKWAALAVVKEGRLTLRA